jgi:hypothetical protein
MRLVRLSNWLAKAAVVLLFGRECLTAADWSVHNRVFADNVLVSDSQTVIQHEAIYDFLQETNSGQSRISIYYPRRRTFRMLDPQVSIQAEVPEDEILRLIADMAFRAKKSDKTVRFAAAPTFRVETENDNTRLRLIADVWKYDLEVFPNEIDGRADQYKLFSDAFARLNVLWFPMPPNARLELNRELHARKLLPHRVDLYVGDEHSFSQHEYSWVISPSLRQELEIVGRHLKEFRIVSVQQFRQLSQPAAFR